jgi:filamentous hemagglutinin
MHRFLEIDPLTMKSSSVLDPQGWNLYAYCVNNPMNLIDPDGKDIGGRMGENWNSVSAALMRDNHDAYMNLLISMNKGSINGIINVASMLTFGLPSVTFNIPVLTTAFTASRTAMLAWGTTQIAVPGGLIGVGLILMSGNNTISDIKDSSEGGENDVNNSESNKPDLKRVEDKYLKKQGIDAHELKKDYLGKKAKIQRYDLSVDKKTGQLYIVNKKNEIIMKTLEYLSK